MPVQICVSNSIRVIGDVDGAIVLDLLKDRFYSLNRTAFEVWMLLNHGNSPESIATQISRNEGIQLDRAVSDVQELLTELEQCGLVQLIA